jgi:ABC-type dipeptide/oligopeptide/nickel transport system permease subunit
MSVVHTTTAAEAPAATLTLDRARRGVARRFLRDPGAVVGALLLLVILVALVAARSITPFDPTVVNPADRLAHASHLHPLGTDLLGRDMLSRVLHGGRTSVSSAVIATLGITVVGLVLGVTAGMLGGFVDSLLMRVVDVLQALPLLIIAMVTIAFLGKGTDKLILTVIILGWPVHARVIRAATLSIRERGFIEAARAQGATKPRIMLRHVVPSLFSPIVALSTIELGRIVLVLSALSFLGFGVQPPQPEWGALLADYRTSFFLAPRLLMYPGLAISMLVFAVNLVGDGVRDALDERGRQL